MAKNSFIRFNVSKSKLVSFLHKRLVLGFSPDIMNGDTLNETQYFERLILVLQSDNSKHGKEKITDRKYGCNSMKTKLSKNLEKIKPSETTANVQQ